MGGMALVPLTRLALPVYFGFGRPHTNRKVLLSPLLREFVGASRQYEATATISNAMNLVSATASRSRKS